MAKQTINIGTAANDGTGDTLRDSYDKCNDNFDELYTSKTSLEATQTEFDNSYRCQIDVAVTTGSQTINYSSAFTDTNYLLEISDPLGLLTLVSKTNSGFTITSSGNGTMSYKATYIK